MMFKRVLATPRTPDGYRLATVEEVNNNRKKLVKKRIVDSSFARLLNGLASVKSDSTSNFELMIINSLSADGSSAESENDSSESYSSISKLRQIPRYMVIYGEDPTHMPRKPSLLRKKLYSSIKPLDQRGNIFAFNLAFMYQDIEVIHWLAADQSLKTELRAEYQKYDTNLKNPHGFYQIVKWLLDEDVHIVEDKVKKALEYASESISSDRLHAITIVELILSTCKVKQKQDSVYSQIESVAVSSEEYTVVLAKLLSGYEVSSLEKGKKFIKLQFEKLFREAVGRGYINLVEYMLQNSRDKVVPKLDAEGKTLLHYAAEWAVDDEPPKYDDDYLDNVFKSLLKIYNHESVKQADKQGRTVLHIASVHRTGDFCKFLVDTYELGNEVDKWGQNFLHYAAQGKYGFEIMVSLEEKIKILDLLSCRNKKGETLLHQAAKNGKRNMIFLLKLWCDKATFSEMIKQTDHLGQTPLHLAAYHGYFETVEELLWDGSDPLEERDISGKTALHHVVANTSLNPGDAFRLIHKLVVHIKTDGQKALFLWASAIGIGTADEMEEINLDLKPKLVEMKKSYPEINLLEAAAQHGNSSLIWELLNRGGDITKIPKKPEFRWVRRQIEKFSEQATDRPIRETRRDTLARRILAECIAAHFLNPYIKSPITVSITGGSGMGKSSLMNMIEAELLLTAAQLAFPNLWQYNEGFNGAKVICPSEDGKKMWNKIEKGVEKLLLQEKSGSATTCTSNTEQINEMTIFHFLHKYRQEYAPVYKYLACMDFRKLLEKEERSTENGSQEQSLGAVPRVLTVRFCAGNYRAMNEAWAGLAVEITKEIEGTMTGAQWLSTAFTNSWKRTKQDVCMKFILPLLVIAFLTLWMVWAAWLLLESSNKPELKKLKYGTIPVTAISVFWYAFKAAISVFNPVSKQLRSYLKFPDHSQQLGYQQKVISDIKFLKEQIGKKPYFIFSLITGEIFGQLFGWWKEKVEGTHVPKYGSVPEDKLRIIAFVDDLDHCEDEVILRVLWAINLVFRECEINVILALDKNTIEKAFKSSSQYQDEDFVDQFISKLIQLPVSLADPADDEWKHFLQKELGHEPNLKSNVDDKIGSSTNENQIEDQSVKNDEPDYTTDSSMDDSGDGRATTNPVIGPINDESASITHHEQVNRRNRGNDVESGNTMYEGCIPSSCGLQQLTNGLPSCLAANEENKSRQVEVSERNRHHLLKRIRHVREAMMQSFTDEEIETFDRLRSFATGILKFPREWKCYISYHKFARNVIARKIKKTGKHPSAWRLEFVAWTFVCSQWKQEMNILIQDWKLYADTKYNNETEKRDSSLKDIVHNYREKRWPTKKADCNEEEQKVREWIRLNEALDTVQEISMKGFSGSHGFRFQYEIDNHQGSNDKAGVQASMKKNEKERWDKLYTALDKIQDVSMEGIECFQEFRFHCAERYLSLASEHSKA